MKLLILLFFLAPIYATPDLDNDPYTRAMEEGMKLLSEVQGPEDFIVAANHFGRIAEVEKEKWHPPYYASYALSIAASMFSNPGQKDETLDAAQKYLDQIVQDDHNASEILALQGFVYMLRIAVDPAIRGQKYSGMSMATLQKAKALDSENPRALFLLAQLSYGTAQFFGSDTTESCQLNEKALRLFEEVENAKDSEVFDPVWGQSFAEEFKARCVN